MAEDTANYLMMLDKAHIEYLGYIRHWENIKMATDEGVIWIKDITRQQVSALEIKSIPFKTIYESRDNQLFLSGHYVPERRMPHLLWTPINRAIQVTLPGENHNYFGVHQQLGLELSLTDEERPPCCLITTAAALKNYIETAPAIRLRQLSWAIINKEYCVIMGSPFLPLPGDTFWKDGNFILPAGFELRLFYGQVNEKINPGNDCWIVWNKNGTYYRINKNRFKPLSLSSFRLSFNINNVE